MVEGKQKGNMSAALALSPVPRVLLADDHPAMLKAVTRMLAPHFDVVAAVSDGKAALDAAEQTNPDVILSDIMMPGLDGLRVAKELRETKSGAKIVFLASQEDDDYIAEALNVGARGYVVKRRLQSDLVPAMNFALSGQLFISPYAFGANRKYEASNHVLKFYLDESIFLQQVSELTYGALAQGEQVFVFLSKIGLHLVRERLRAGGLDYQEAIKRGHFYAFSVENVMPSLMQDSWPDPSRFEDFFCRFWKRAVARARVRGSQVTIISDMIATLLRQGLGHRVAARVEELWNTLVPRYSCTVYCGCPVMHLSSKENRETLSQICAEHSNVIPTDQRICTSVQI
jgi:DNA-binding NarL/FixJ family response regulator